MKKQLILIFSFCITLFSCSVSKVSESEESVLLTPEEEISQISDRLTQFCKLFEGEFVQKEFNLGSKQYEDYFIYNHLPIWPDRMHEHWYYVEGALAGLREDPVVQDVLQVSYLAPDTLQLAIFEVINKEQVRNAWKNEGALSHLQKRLIQPKPGCKLLLTRTADTFKGFYPDKCALSLDTDKITSIIGTMSINYEGLCINSETYGPDGKVISEFAENCTPFTRKQIDTSTASVQKAGRRK